MNNQTQELVTIQEQENELNKLIDNDITLLFIKNYHSYLTSLLTKTKEYIEIINAYKLLHKNDKTNFDMLCTMLYNFKQFKNDLKYLLKNANFNIETRVNYLIEQVEKQADICHCKTCKCQIDK